MFKSPYSIYLIFLFLVLSSAASSQINFSTNHNVLAEFGIEEGFSLRYENSILVKDNFLLLGYLGVSTQYTTFIDRGSTANTLGIPVGINRVFGKSKNHFETSIGYLWQKSFYESLRSIRHDEYQLKLGYRYQKIKANSFIFKTGLLIFFPGKNEGSDIVYRGIDSFGIGGFIGVGYGF